MTHAVLLRRLTGLLFAAAFLSLALQAEGLLDSGGLLPLADSVARLRAESPGGLLLHPTLFWWGLPDPVLYAALGVGLLASCLAVADVLARPALAVAWLLWLSFSTAHPVLLSWAPDGLLLQTGLLVLCLPSRGQPRFSLLLLRILVAKVYLEAGLHKLAAAGEGASWLDGAAFRSYLETTVLPTPLAWYAFHLPAPLHTAASLFALSVELAAAPLLLAGRRGRRAAFVLLTLLQVSLVLTGSYGLLSYVLLVLHVSLLDGPFGARGHEHDHVDVHEDVHGDGHAHAHEYVDVDPPLCLAPLGISPVWRGSPDVDVDVDGPGPPKLPRLRRFVPAFSSSLLVSAWIFQVGGSVGEVAATRPARAVLHDLRLSTELAMFRRLPEERIEWRFEVLPAGGEAEDWRPVFLRHAVGPPDRTASWTGPHHARLPNLLWFGPTALGRSPPSPSPSPLDLDRPYLHAGPTAFAIADRLCADPGSLAPLLAGPPPAAPEKSRIALVRYRFTTPEERDRTGRVWEVEALLTGPETPCPGVARSSPAVLASAEGTRRPDMRDGQADRDEAAGLRAEMASMRARIDDLERELVHARETAASAAALHRQVVALEHQLEEVRRERDRLKGPREAIALTAEAWEEQRGALATAEDALHVARLALQGEEQQKGMEALATAEDAVKIARLALEKGRDEKGGRGMLN